MGDADVLKCIRMLTFLPLEQIDEMAEWKDAKLNEAKKELKRELIKKENQKLAGENQYLPGIYKMLMMACRLPLV